jgi:hypothetical protein
MACNSPERITTTRKKHMRRQKRTSEQARRAGGLIAEPGLLLGLAAEPVLVSALGVIPFRAQGSPYCPEIRSKEILSNC